MQWPKPSLDNIIGKKRWGAYTSSYKLCLVMQHFFKGKDDAISFRDGAILMKEWQPFCAAICRQSGKEWETQANYWSFPNVATLKIEGAHIRAELQTSSDHLNIFKNHTRIAYNFVFRCNKIYMLWIKKTPPPILELSSTSSLSLCQRSCPKNGKLFLNRH